MNAEQLERARPLTGPADTDAVTFAWAEADGGLSGLMRLGRSAVSASVLAVVFSGPEPVAALTEGGLDAAGTGWENMSAGGLDTSVDVPLQRWSARLDAAGARFELAFDALSPPALLDERAPAVRAGGMGGYEQLCRVRGTARIGGRERRVRGLGQRGRSWGAPDWERIALTRALGVWLDDGTGVVAQAVRPAYARTHAGEATWAALLSPSEALDIEQLRLTTTADAGGRQRRAGLELWVGAGDAHPRRVAGEVLCGSTLGLGKLRLDCAFFRWHMEGRAGVGRYDVLRVL